MVFEEESFDALGHRMGEAVDDFGNAVAFLLPVDDIRPGEHGAATGDAGNPPARPGQGIQRLDAVAQTSHLFVKKASGSGGAAGSLFDGKEAFILQTVYKQAFLCSRIDNAARFRMKMGHRTEEGPGAFGRVDFMLHSQGIEQGNARASHGKPRFQGANLAQQGGDGK